MKKRHFSHCRYCIPIHQAALLSRADPRLSRAFLLIMSTYAASQRVICPGAESLEPKTLIIETPKATSTLGDYPSIQNGDKTLHCRVAEICDSTMYKVDNCRRFRRFGNRRKRHPVWTGIKASRGSREWQGVFRY